MRGGSDVWHRTQRLEATRQRAAVCALAQRLAAELRISTEELLADAAALQQRRMQAAGAITRDQQLAFVAAEGGIPEDELRAELTRVRAAP